MEKRDKIALILSIFLFLFLAAFPFEIRNPPQKTPEPHANQSKGVLILTFDVENPYSRDMYQPLGYTDPDPTPYSNATVPKVLKLLEGKGVEATFFFVGWTADNYPELVKAVQESGSEAAVHGYSHTPILPMTQSQREEDLRKSLEAVERHNLSRGFRSPQMQVDDALLGELSALGFRYDSSYDRFYYPGKRPFRSAGMVELPVDRPNDWEAYESHKIAGSKPFPGDTWLRYRKARLDKAVAEGDVVVQLHHPWVIARSEDRLEALAEFIDYAKAYEAEGRLEILTCGEYVERYW